MIIASHNDLTLKFYNRLLNDRDRKHRVLILAATDVDSVCAVKILVHLLDSDNVLYSLVICSRFADCVSAVELVRNTVRNIVMINCGATEDVFMQFNLNSKSKTRFFILDSRLPVHLCNLYSASHVCVLRKVDASEVPDFDSVFTEEKKPSADTVDNSIRDDQDETMIQSSQMSQGSQVANSREEREKRKQEAKRKAEWNINRKIIENNYYKSVSYEDSSAMKMFELAHLISKDDHNLFFWAVIGLCDMFVQRKISSSEFVKKSIALQGHVIRLTHNIDVENRQAFRITYGQDLALRFYRQWTIFDSMCSTPYTASIFRTWETKGHQKLHELLADMGFPLSQCKQTFSAMDYEIKENMVEWFKEQAAQWNLPDLISSGTFLASYGFNQKFQINDIALGLHACLTLSDTTSPEENVHDALEILSKEDFKRIEYALRLGREQLSIFRNIVQSAFEERLFVGMNTYLQVCLDNISSTGNKFTGRPEALVPLALFLQQTYVVRARGNKVSKVPFVLGAELLPPSADPDNDWVYFVGLPGHDNINSGVKNFMGRAFREASNRVKVDVEQWSFDEYTIRIRKKNKITFLDALILIFSLPNSGAA